VKRRLTSFLSKIQILSQFDASLEKLAQRKEDSIVNSIVEYIQKHQSSFIEELKEFLRIPSISASKAHREDCRRAAQWLMARFQSMGFENSLHETAGNPVVLAQYKAGEGKPTLLIYGHYDVQPADPEDLWLTPPFEPSIQYGKIFARGATDDKGQIYTHIKAAEAHLKIRGSLPVNLIFLIEGEEEIASNNLEKFIRENKDKLRADAAVISDGSQFALDAPAICYGLRGICVEEIRVEGAGWDLHSGSFGGATPNPLNEMCAIVAKLKDAKGKITIPGFYDDVAPLEPWEKKAFAELPWDDESFCCELKLPGLFGEEGYSTIERKWARPTLDVNGIFGGYEGEGSKTIIPAWGGAKITMRLVPHQNPKKISALFREYVQEIAPPHIRILFAPHSGCGPVAFPRSAPFMAEAENAIQNAFGKPPVFIREGGSIPIVLTMKEELGLHTLLLGWGQPDDGAHSPNERFHLQDFERGIAASAWLMELCGKK